MTMTEFDIRNFCYFVCDNRDIKDEKFIESMIEKAPRDSKEKFLQYVAMRLHEKNH